MTTLPIELHEAGADQVPDAFGVGHDARDQDAGLRRVEVADRQPRDVRLDPAPHVGDRALRGHAEHLRQREGRDRLDERRGAGRQRERHQQLGALLPDDVVDQVLRGRRQHEARETRLTSISTRPSASRPRRAQISVARFLPRVPT